MTPNPNTPTLQKVLSVQHWTDTLFSFTLERPESFRFRSGEFIMLGLEGENGAKPIMRAYSIASPSWDEVLEFYSIKVPDGPLTSRLQKIQVGDSVLLGKKPVGTLVLDALTPAKHLYMLATGTGLAPFASLIREPETYEKFEKVILCHTCRNVAELAYGKKLVQETLNHEFLGELANGKLIYYDSVTREAYHRQGRITDNITSGKLFAELGFEKLNPITDRVMICGSTQMTLDCKNLCITHGMTEGANSAPAEFIIERAFVG
jgi:ferredoxin--NADP+ reductase